MSLKIIKTSLVAQNSFYLEKYCERAQMQVNHESTREQSQTVLVMSVLAHYMTGRYLEGTRMLVNMPDEQSLSIEGNSYLEQFIRGVDLAYYLVLSGLAHCSRLELKNDVMSKGNILNLLEQYEDLTTTFDNFLNGKFELL